MLLLGFLDKVGVFWLGNVSTIDHDDLAAFLNMVTKFFKILLLVKVLRLQAVEFKNDAMISSKLSGYSRFACTW